MNEEQLQAGAIIYYKMGDRVCRQKIKKVSPSGRCILVADDKRDIWLDVNALDVIETEPKRSASHTTNTKSK